MRRIGFVFLYIFSVSIGFCSNLPDTLKIKNQLIDLQIGQAMIAVGDDLNDKEIEELVFTKTDLPLNIKSNVILRELISYTAEIPAEVIVEPSGFHYIDVYLKNIASDNTILKSTGRLVRFPENEMYENYSVINKVKLILEPGSIYELIIFYRNPHKEKIKIDLSISDIGTWNDNLSIINNSSSSWSGIFFGTLILLSLVNSIFYYLFRDRTYIVYVGYILTILIYQACLFGLFDKSFVKYIPKVFHLIINTSLILFIIFYLLFLRDFLNLKENYPRWNKLIKYLIIYLVIILFATNVLFLMGRPISGYVYRNIGLLVLMPIVIVFLVNVVFSKRLVDRVFFTGSIFLVISGLVSIISYLSNNFGNSDIYLQIGILIELVIFNIGLGLRSKVIQNEKDAELHQLILKLRDSEENQKILNISLEEKVEERTRKINEINLELTKQRDQLFEHKETIEQNLVELNDVRKNLVHTVYQKTKELRHANKELVAQNAQLEQYAFITAHNLKAPVARLKGLVNIFELTNNSSNSNNEIVYRIKEASLDMDDVISDINKILKIKNFSQQDRKDVNIEILIDKIKKRLEDRIHENKTTVETGLQSITLPSIDTYLESILYNLIYNGIKYSREGVDSYIRVQSYRSRNRVYIEVKDNGIGIDLDRFGEKIFGLYQRFHDHVNGKGIGLYLVKTQVEALNGKIAVESEVNKGTSFKLSFPIQ